MSNNDNCGSGSTFLSFLTGALVGATVALLLTPRTGKETRKILADYRDEMKDRTSSLRESFPEQTASIVAHGKEMIEHGKKLVSRGTEMVSEGKGFLDDKKKALNEAIEAGKKAMEQEKEALTSSLSAEDE
ncbi:MAG: YtxH domain-containing protein [Proteobacteria bacterium]|nr:YtxH domain-containing protein [Pseudomonadota bacterium]MBU1715219.1 YtxH domain-containing protein [Pseudomonadota bacterium]